MAAGKIVDACRGETGVRRPSRRGDGRPRAPARLRRPGVVRARHPGLALWLRLVALSPRPCGILSISEPVGPVCLWLAWAASWASLAGYVFPLRLLARRGGPSCARRSRADGRSSQAWRCFSIAHRAISLATGHSGGDPRHRAACWAGRSGRRWPPPWRWARGYPLATCVGRALLTQASLGKVSGASARLAAWKAGSTRDLLTMDHGQNADGRLMNQKQPAPPRKRSPPAPDREEPPRRSRARGEGLACQTFDFGSAGPGLPVPAVVC